MENISSVVEWLECQDYDQHGLSSKPTCSIYHITLLHILLLSYLSYCIIAYISHILLCPGERDFMALSPAWWSWQAVLNYRGQQYLGISESRLG